MASRHVESTPVSPTEVTPRLDVGTTRRPSTTALLLRKIREILREPIAEFLGVNVFVILGLGSTCQTVLSANQNVAPTPSGTSLSLNFGWAIGLGLGVRACVGISGGHVNPAITVAMAAWRGFPWKKVPIYIFSQMLGSVVGSALIYAQYIHAIDLFEGGRDVRTRATAAIFAPYPVNYMTAVSSFFSEFLGTAILAFMIMASTDSRAAPASPSHLPFVIFVTLLGLGVALGMQTSGSFNPARDFGPRLLLTMVGYSEHVYSYQSQYWLWCGILAPILGALTSAGIYELFLGHALDNDAQSAESVRDMEKA